MIFRLNIFFDILSGKLDFPSPYPCKITENPENSNKNTIETTIIFINSLFLVIVLPLRTCGYLIL
jgi:hypothetical protein